MAYRLFVDSSNGVTIEPDKDIKIGATRIADTHRSTTGQSYVYVWGEYPTVDFNVSYVDSSFRATVNSWWGGNQKLLFKSESDSLVSSVHIVGTSQPIQQTHAPYIDLFRGSIKLEGY